MTVITYDQPDPDGASLAGLSFAVLLVVGLLGLGSGGLLAAHTRWGGPATWPRRFLYVGGGAGVLASAVVTLWNVVAQIPDGSLLEHVLPPIGGLLFGSVILSAAVILLCTALGILTQIAQAVSEGIH
ncbi:hypothetical protein C444_14576 [Haloarcula japonica DSM 6131]|uniref:Uncharacterized protein n=1 Tax=Haloarcula japonica (strain ATCC 49778 / DSM 6131 / JCM 7785 / NBRC 101032 / NCIMB 13157 / TR-1) TaxID=1227453 RepID=M0L9W3_HALJT|nr:hypothetical protein C444_14576 [Haloarcula japonica DSM 6131]